MRGWSLVLMLALLAAGCADDDEADPDDGADGGDDLRPPVTWMVNVTDNAFGPQELTIQVGDTVHWMHSGGNPHTVTADGAFDSHPDCQTFIDSSLGNCMEDGDTFEHTFDATGEVDYRCKIHGPMTGTIVVLDRYDETP